MGLMKQEAASLGTVRLTLRDIEASAQAKLDQANALAQIITSEARAIGFDAGRADGFAEGMARGLEQGTQQAVHDRASELTDLLTAMQAAVDRFAAAHAQMQADAIADAVELAIAISQRVTKRQASMDPQVLLANVSEAMNAASRTSRVRIALHPSQARLLVEALPQLQIDHPALRDVDLIDDISIAPGGCRVFTPNGKIDAGIEAQLDRIVRELMPESS